MQKRGHTGTISLMLLVGCLCLSTLVAGQDLQKAKTDFLAGNPNNGWTFGFLDKTGAFVAYNSTFKVDENTLGWCLDDMPGVFGDVTMCFSDKPLDKFGIQWETGQLCVNPGLDCQGVVIRWTAPGPATLNINSRLKGSAKNGGKTGVRVCKDGSTIASDVVAGDGFVDAPMEPPTKESRPAASTVSASADLNTSISVSKGSVIDFIFAKDGERSGSHVGFDLTMQATGSDGGKVSYNPSPVGTRAASRIASTKAVAK